MCLCHQAVQSPSSTIWYQPKGGDVKADLALHRNLISELRDVTCHMGSHSVTCHPTQVNAPCLTPAMQTGTRFTYPGGMEGWVDLVGLIVPWPGIEPATFRSRVWRRTATPPRQRDARPTVTAAGKVTVGLASHWPCVTDFSGLSTYGLTDTEREMSTPPTLQMEYGPLFLFLISSFNSNKCTQQTASKFVQCTMQCVSCTK